MCGSAVMLTQSVHHEKDDIYLLLDSGHFKKTLGISPSHCTYALFVSLLFLINTNTNIASAALLKCVSLKEMS